MIDNGYVSLYNTFLNIPALISKRSVFLSSGPGYLQKCDKGIFGEHEFIFIYIFRNIKKPKDSCYVLKNQKLLLIYTEKREIWKMLSA